MSYNKYTWTTGETITADKMNHIEDGIAEGESSSVDLPFVARFRDNNAAITPITSYLDVQAALEQGRTILGVLYSESATTGWLSAKQERYGMPVYVFGFLKDSIIYGAGVSVEYIAVRLKPDNTVESETKTLAFAN